jgi:ketosteroid isomerase-like protein
MQKLLIVFAVGMLAAGRAVASEKADVVAVVKQWTDSFNKGDFKSAIATCADDAAIIDDMPPFEWHGPGACGKWSDSYGASVKAHEITGVTVTLATQRTVEVVGDRAYVAGSATYVGTQKGKPIKIKARVTMTLQKGSAGWRITGWSWSD